MLDKEDITFLLNLLKREEFRARHVLKNKHRYSKTTIERAYIKVEKISRIIDKLTDMDPERRKEKEKVRKDALNYMGKEEDKEKKLKELEARLEILETVVKKLQAYHEGI